jgi:hypothetical protein
MKELQLNTATRERTTVKFTMQNKINRIAEDFLMTALKAAMGFNVCYFKNNPINECISGKIQH